MTHPAIDWKNPDYGPVWKHRLAVLKKLRESPKDMAEVKVYYRDHPADFINDWMSTYDPRNLEVKREATMPFLLYPKQREFIEWLHKLWLARDDGVVEKSRDAGASWLCVGFAVWMWAFYAGSVVGFGSRKEDLVDHIGDPNSLFWKIRMCVKLLPPDFRPDGYDDKVHAPYMRLLNPENGAVVVGEAGANIGRGARCSIYFKDESAFYENPQSIDNALSETANCKIDISTPNGVGNPFWQKTHGGKLPKFVFDWRDDPRKGPEWYANAVAKKDAVTVAQEIDRDYNASITNSWISTALVDEAAARGPADYPGALAPLRVGLDVARFGDDKTVLTFRRGRIVVRQAFWKKTDLMSTAGRAKQEIDAFVKMRNCPLEQIAVDVIGIGAGVADALRGWYTTEGLVVDVNSALRMDDELNFNLRAFMWREMKDWLENARPCLPKLQELRTDLTGLRYFYRGGLLLIEAKDEAKKRGLKSPDFGDSLALTFAMPGQAKTKPKVKGVVMDYGMIDQGMGL